MNLIISLTVVSITLNIEKFDRFKIFPHLKWQTFLMVSIFKYIYLPKNLMKISYGETFVNSALQVLGRQRTFIK